MGYFSESVNNLDLIDRMYRRREATMDTKYLVIDDNTQGKEVEHVCEVVPDIRISIFPSTFRIETV